MPLKGNKHSHTIYVAGPTAVGNMNWLRESKILYRILKREATKNGDTIELFPKTRYRDSILSEDGKLQRRIPSSRQLSELYKNTNVLIDDLLRLIVDRYNEIIDINDELEAPTWNEKIHLKAYGKGGEILIDLLNTNCSELIGILIVFEGDSSCSEDTDEATEDRIINITINVPGDEDIYEFGSRYSTKKLLGTLGAVVGIMATIIALL